MSNKNQEANEGDECTFCEKGVLEYVRKGECSCHISPPCQSCVDSVLECDYCGCKPLEVEDGN